MILFVRSELLTLLTVFYKVHQEHLQAENQLAHDLCRPLDQFIELIDKHKGLIKYSLMKFLICFK